MRTCIVRNGCHAPGMDIVLVPGLWLDASCWDAVVPHLEKAGHHAHPLTLPGLESAAADRSGVRLADHVAAVTAAIDEATTDGGGPVLLVGHSLGCAVAWGALDARVERVAKVAYVGGWPAPSGTPLAKGFPTEGDDLVLPGPDDFDEADLRDLGYAALAERAIPSPASLTREALELTDERRYDVPALFVCPEFTAAQLASWIEDGEESVAEIPRLAHASYVDLPTGHWPQLTRPQELAAILAEAADTADATAATDATRE